MWNVVRNRMIRDGVNRFSGYGEVYTNRLHALILGPSSAAK